MLDSKQQLQHSINVLGQQLQDKQQQLDHQKARYACSTLHTLSLYFCLIKRGWYLANIVHMLYDFFCMPHTAGLPWTLSAWHARDMPVCHFVFRCTEFETEVSSVRDTVMVLAKTIGSQPKGHELPGHEDPIWSKLGPLGGVQHALEVVIKHVRVSPAGGKQ